VSDKIACVIENITQVAIAMGKQQFQKKNTYKENQ
jgi:hypothetical protein